MLEWWWWEGFVDYFSLSVGHNGSYAREAIIKGNTPHRHSHELDLNPQSGGPSVPLQHPTGRYK